MRWPEDPAHEEAGRACFSHGAQGSLPEKYFMALYYELTAFNQYEMGAKKIKRQNFLIEGSAFFIFLNFFIKKEGFLNRLVV